MMAPVGLPCHPWRTVSYVFVTRRWVVIHLNGPEGQ